MDFRIYKIFVNFTPLHQPTAYMDATEIDGMAAQINTLYGARELFHLPNLKSVQNFTKKAVENACDALGE